MALDQNRASEIVTTIEDFFFGITKSDPRISHLDQVGSDWFWWDTYHISNTAYRLYLHIEVTDIDEGENANIFITVEASTDPDYRDNHEDFIDNNETYRFNLKVKDFDTNNAPIDTNKLITGCQKGFDTIMRALQVHAQTILKEIDERFANKEIDNFKEHAWLMEEWVNVEEVIDFAGFSYTDIPYFITYLGDSIMIKYLPQTVKDVFIF